jgi:glycine hydroxymethyltransferase
MSPFITSGIRLGTPACTSRGFKEEEFIIVGEMISDVLDGLRVGQDNSAVEQSTVHKIKNMLQSFPIY